MTAGAGGKGRFDLELRTEFEASLQVLLGRPYAIGSITERSAIIYLNGLDEAKLLVQVLQAAALCARLEQVGDESDCERPA